MAQSPPPTSGPASPPGPTPPAPPTLPNRGKRTWAWLFGLLPAMLVVGVIAGYLAWGPDDPTRVDPSQPTGDPTATPTPLTLQLGRDYYVFVKTIELFPRQPGDKTWDKLDGSAPDIRYSLTWNGHTGYTSDTRSDTLIGLWDPITIDVAEALPMLGEGKLELRSTLNQGAIINATNDQALTIDVWDEDPAGFGKDEAGQVVINVADLLQGDQTLHFEETETNAIKRIVIGTTDTAQPLQSLIEALSSPNAE